MYAVLCLLLCIGYVATGPVSRVRRATEDFDRGTILSTVQSPELNEISGVAASRQHEGILYVINDSGGLNSVYAIDTKTGELRATFHIRGSANCDWEDLAVGPGPVQGLSYIYVGDIGGNALLSCQVVYRIVEPSVIIDGYLLIQNSFSFTWPENNCETLMVDPAGELYLVSKTEPGNQVNVYKVPQEAWDSVQTVQLSGGSAVNIVLEEGADGPVAGDISPYNYEILLKTYNNIYLYNKEHSEEVSTALTKQPQALYYKVEEQGESIAWDPYGTGFYTISEGDNKEIYYYAKL